MIKAYLKYIKEHKYCKVSIMIFLIFMNLLTIEKLSWLRGNYQTFGEGVTPFLIFGADIWLIQDWCKVKSSRNRVMSGIGGCLLAFSHVYGMYLHYANDLLTNLYDIMFQLLLVAGMMILTVPLFSLLLDILDKICRWWMLNQDIEEKNKPRGLFLKYWGIIFCCYLPLFLHWWPGNFVFDSGYQLAEEVKGHYKIHHPILHTLLMGKCYKLGQVLGNVSFGASLYTLIQMLILAAAFAYTMVYLYKKRTPKGIRIAVLLFYAIFPMNPIFAITATKDVLFAAFFLIVLVLLVELCYDQEKMTWKKAVSLLVAGILLALFRKNAMYALVLAIPFLLWARKGWKQKGLLAVLLLGIVILSGQIDDHVLKAVKATNDDSLQESMSVPLQQIVRVVRYRGDELDETLYQEVLAYWDEDSLKGYNPYLSDPIKGSVNVKLLEQNIINFWKLWGKIGLKFPGEYIESFLTNTMGYWYLGDSAYGIAEEVAIYHTLIGVGDEIEKTDLLPIASVIYDDLYFRVEYKNVPLLAYTFRCCVYFWILLVYALYVIYRKEYKKMMPMLLAFTYVASCFFGPLSSLRYIYCIVVSIPVIIMLGLQREKEN